jgi:5-methylcytosine-specific restriction endonuclease McrA
MSDRIEELAEQIARMSPNADLQKFVNAAKELAGRINERARGKVSNRPSIGSDEYRELRHAVLDRDRWQCRSCLKTRNLTVDHIISRGQGGADEIDNLWALCATCHDLKEKSILRPIQDQTTGRWRMLDRRQGA